MSSSSFGQGPKKETIYSGPAPSRQGTVYSGPSAGGTVYNGPAAGGTVYNNPIGGQAPANRLSGPQTSVANAKAAKVFYFIAFSSVLNMVLLFIGFRIAVGLSFIAVPGASLAAVFGLNLLPAALFAGLGVMAGKGSKAAFLIGAVLYAGDMVLLAMNNPGLHPISIVIHGILLFSMFKIFRDLPD